jgi:aerobic carbon-monoxide dehydrogenase large subunit
LLRGEGRYTDDFALTGQVYAAFVRCPHAHARIISIDASRATRAIACFTGADYASDGLPINHTPVPADVIDYRRPAFSGVDEPHWPLAVDEVRFQGEAVAVVIAASAAEAEDAAALVEVEYAVLEQQSRVGAQAAFGDHDATEHAIAHADVVIEQRLVSQRIANAQLEPRAAIGSYDAETDSYLMIAGSQGAVRQRAALAQALNVPVERVRVISPDVGGGFGPRTSLYPEQVVVVWAARRIGRPVRWTSTRSEAFLTDFQGRDSVMRGRLAVRADGAILGLAVRAEFNVGGRPVSYVPLNNAARILTSVYDIPTACAHVQAVLSNTVPTGPYRGAGRPETIYLVERLLDIAATRLDMDRVELRRRNLIKREQLPYRTAMGLTYDSGDFRGNMERTLAAADWGNFAQRRRGKVAGIGLANYVEAPVGAPHERVEITVQPHGMVEVTVGTQSSGQGHATAFAQVLAHELGVEPARVQLIGGDTQQVQAGGGTHSDRSMRLVGTLLVEAAERIREQAQRIREAQRRELDLFTCADIELLHADASFTGRLPAHPTGCAVAEVEIDPDTGKLQVTRYTSVDDVGQPINPMVVHGQVHGGIAQGLGQALSEKVVFDSTGQTMTASFADYAIPHASDLPEFETLLAEDPTGGNPLRIKGAGEAGITPALAAAVNAAADALGSQDLHMPLSAERVWMARLSS